MRRDEIIINTREINEAKKESIEEWPKVAIIILNWNGWKDIIECLESVFRIDYPNYQVIALDNGSSDDSVEKIKAWASGEIPVESKFFDYNPDNKPIQVIQYDRVTAESGGFYKEKLYLEKFPSNKRMVIIQTGENLGYTGGNSIGLRFSISLGMDYALILNNDTVVDPVSLKEMVNVAIQNSEVGVVGAVVCNYWTQKVVFTNSKIDRKLKMAWRTDYVNANTDSWETDVVYGCAMLLNLDQVVKHKLFLDENLFLFCDELDLCIRAKRKKLKVVMAGKARIYHKEASSYNSDLKPIFVFYALRNRILLAHKFLSPLEMILFWILFTGSRLIRCVQWIFEGKFELIKATWLAFKDGIHRKGGKNV